MPVLTHGAETVVDSWRIAVYLEDRFPDHPSLFGGGDAISLTSFVNSWADSALVPAIARVILVDIHNCLDVDDRLYFRSSRESLFRTSLEAVVEDQPARLKDLRRALHPLRLGLDEIALLDHNFIAGRRLPRRRASADKTRDSPFELNIRTGQWARRSAPGRHRFGAQKRCSSNVPCLSEACELAAP